MSKSLYVCGTYYHVLIAIMRVLANEQESADFVLEDTIPAYCSLQNAIEQLEKVCTVTVFNRKEIQVSKLSGNKRHKENVKNFELNMKINFSKYNEIYLFNDRTLFGYYLIDKKIKFNLLEDGANYFQDIHRVNNRPQVLNEVRNMLRFAKFPFGIVSQLHKDYMTLGQSKFCKSITVSDKTNLFIPYRKLIKLSFMDLFERLTYDNRKLILRTFFSNETLRQQKASVLILTQPLYEEKMVSSRFIQIKVYEKIISEYVNNSQYEIFIKPHPRDTTDYLYYFPSIRIINPLIPVEIFEFYDDAYFDTVVSITSSAIYNISKCNNKIVLGFEYLENFSSMCIRDIHENVMEEYFSVPSLDTCLPIFPAFENGNIAVSLSCNNNYAPFMATLLESLIENSSISKNYDIIVLYSDMNSQNKRKLLQMISNHTNFALRFVNMREFINKEMLHTKLYLSIETWYRLFLPQILVNYDKVLYLDTDMIVNHDISELFNIDISNNLLGAVLCVSSVGAYCKGDILKVRYTDQVLKLSQPLKYFQAGTLLFNLNCFRKTYTTEYMLELAGSYKWNLLDQDVLNILCQNKVKFIDMKWNVVNDYKGRLVLCENLPGNILQEYINSRQEPYIVHYAGAGKPWNTLSIDMHEYFWKYAKCTPFYEAIICRLLKKVSSDSISKKTCFSTFIDKIYKKSIIINAINIILPLKTKRREYVKKLLKRGG